MILGAQVADDVDALDVDALALVDGVDEIDRMVGVVAIGARPDAGEGIATLGHLQRQRLGGLVDVGRVVDLPRNGQQVAAVLLRPDRRQRALDAHVAESVELTFLDRVGDEETRPVAVDLGVAGDHAHVGVAVLQVVLPQQLLIQAHTIRIVDVGALEEIEPARLGGRDDVAQLRVGKHAVADEIDLLDLRRRTFRDLEHQVDSVLVEFDQLRLHRRGEPALPAVDVEDALHVGQRLGAGVDRARLELHLVLQRRRIDLAVALEGDLRNDRILDDRDHHAGAVAIDSHVGEQAGLEQRLQRAVDFAGVVGVADRELQVGAHRLGLDPAIADHADIADDALRLRHANQRRSPRRMVERGKRREHGDEHHDEAHQPRGYQREVRHTCVCPSLYPSPPVQRRAPVGTRGRRSRVGSRSEQSAPCRVTRDTPTATARLSIQ